MVRSLVKAKVNTGTCKIKKVKKAEKKEIWNAVKLTSF